MAQIFFSFRYWRGEERAGGILMITLKPCLGLAERKTSLGAIGWISPGFNAISNKNNVQQLASQLSPSQPNWTTRSSKYQTSAGCHTSMSRDGRWRRRNRGFPYPASLIYLVGLGPLPSSKWFIWCLSQYVASSYFSSFLIKVTVWQGDLALPSTASRNIRFP